MNEHRHEYPWIFRRDEIDVLEDELDHLYETFCLEDETAPESAVLHEQLRTEEHSRDSMHLRLGHEALPSSEPCSHRCDVQQASVLALLRSHPLYQQARVWARQVQPHVKEGYEQGARCGNELFRIYANMQMVPLKIFSALCQEAHGDLIGFELAQEEYRLALVYLDRILNSMKVIMFLHDGEGWLTQAQLQTMELRKSIARSWSGLSHRQKGSL